MADGGKRKEHLLERKREIQEEEVFEIDHDLRKRVIEMLDALPRQVHLK